MVPIYDETDRDLLIEAYLEANDKVNKAAEDGDAEAEQKWIGKRQAYEAQLNTMWESDKYWM